MSALIEVALKASILMAGAAAVVAVLSRASAATRHFVWTLAIAGLLLLPIVTAVLPTWEVAVPILPTAALEPIDAPRAAGVAPSIPVAPARGVASVAVVPESNPIVARVPWAAMAALLYVLGLLTLSARLLVQRRMARHIARQATTVVDPEWTRLLAQCAARVGVERPVTLLRTREQLMPMTMGTLAPIVMVPADADAWDQDRRQAVLLHELAHIARRDCLTQMLGAIACAVYWVHPAVWYIARRLRIEREVACDDRVLAAGAHAPNYAEHLLELAYAWSGRRAPALVVGMAGSKKLEGRMRAVLDSTRNRAAPTRRTWLAGTAVAAALLLLIGAVTMTTSASADGRSTMAVWLDDAFEQDVQAADGSDTFTGTWEIRPGRTSERVRIVLEARGFSVNGEIDAHDIDRFAPQLLSTANGPIRLNISREAGTLRIDGTLKASAGSGTFTFVPSETFIASLIARGFARPTARQLFTLAQHDIGLAFVDELALQKYARPEVSELARAANHGVVIDFVREMAQAGYRVGTLDVLIRFRDHGVDPEFVRELRAQGLSDLSPDDLVRARDHGVDAEYVGGLKDLGYAPLPFETLVRARDHGVDPEYISGMRQLGATQTLEDLIRTRDHGVDPEFVSEMRRLGYALMVPELIRARDHGVTPDYIESMATVGYKGLPIETLIRLRDHGVTPDYVEEVRKRGFKDLSAEEIIRLRDQGTGSRGTVLRKLHDTIATFLFEIGDEVSAFLEETRKK
jgi:beta-lactamase regulating signal transducer with metallopeptidase domain